MRAPNFRHLAYIALATCTLLLIPLISMQFSNDVQWSVSDFIVAGMVIFGAGVVFELATQRAKTANSKLVIGTALVFVLSIIWIQLAANFFD